MSESSFRKRFLDAFQPKNITTRLFRNNSGIAYNVNGAPVKFGIPEKGGADLLGWRSIEITPDMVGQTVAVFCAYELKTVKDTLKKDQKNFLNCVSQAGGEAVVVREVESGGFSCERF